MGDFASKNYVRYCLQFFYDFNNQKRVTYVDILIATSNNILFYFIQQDNSWNSSVK